MRKDNNDYSGIHTFWVVIPLIAIAYAIGRVYESIDLLTEAIKGMS